MSHDTPNEELPKNVSRLPMQEPTPAQQQAALAHHLDTLHTIIYVLTLRGTRPLVVPVREVERYYGNNIGVTCIVKGDQLVVNAKNEDSKDGEIKLT